MAEAQYLAQKLTKNPRTVTLVCTRDGGRYDFTDDGGSVADGEFFPGGQRQHLLRMLEKRGLVRNPKTKKREPARGDAGVLYILAEAVEDAYPGDALGNYPVLDAEWAARIRENSDKKAATFEQNRAEIAALAEGLDPAIRKNLEKAAKAASKPAAKSAAKDEE